ncbi:hypothetical protein ACLKA7_001555 [Drosophila subpalustris]
MESLASLKGLGIDISTWDPILIEVLRNKLDSTNKTLYEQSISDSKHIQKLDTMPLADPQFNKPGKIDMLIGAEHYYALLLPQQHKLMPSGPMMQQTKLGWVVAGKIMELNMSPAICAVSTGEETNAILERFWSLDNFDTSEKHRTPVEKACEKHFIDNLQIAADGRFIVKLPFSEYPSALGPSLETAERRFLSLETRTKAEIWKGYVDFMAEYEKLGHMKIVPRNLIPSINYFIPHHCVLKPDSSTTKLRVVLDLDQS